MNFETKKNLELKLDEFRIGLPLLIASFVVAFIVGMLIMCLLVKIFYCIIRKDNFRDNSEEIDILERWTIAEK